VNRVSCADIKPLALKTIQVQTNGTAPTPIRFEAASGAHVVLTGADWLTDWRRADEARPIMRYLCGKSEAAIVELARGD
jgi:hypothetical protein